MQAQVEKTKGELLGEYRGKFVTTTIKEISPAGVRIEINEQGEVKGKLNSAHIETVSVLLKPEGTSEWETKALETTKDGDVVVAWGGGKARSTGPNAVAWEGEIHYMTQSPRLAWLNNATAQVEGTTNMATGEVQGKAYTK